MIAEATATLVIEPGFVVRRGPDDILVATDERDALLERGLAAEDTQVDPVRLEIFHHRFMSIAEQMGAVLERTAMSTNIRDRLDFSCAIFDAAGALIANAPHIPVHLGAMSESVLAVCAAHPQMQPGDVVTYYSDASHVGIYIGDGMMVHASTFGVPVRVAPVDNAPIYNVRRY